MMHHCENDAPTRLPIVCPTCRDNVERDFLKQNNRVADPKFGGVELAPLSAEAGFARPS